jgi:hypothetical protein
LSSKPKQDVQQAGRQALATKDICHKKKKKKKNFLRLLSSPDYSPMIINHDKKEEKGSTRIQIFSKNPSSSIHTYPTLTDTNIPSTLLSMFLSITRRYISCPTWTNMILPWLLLRGHLLSPGIIITISKDTHIPTP